MMTVNVVFIMLIYFHDVDDDVVNGKKIVGARIFILRDGAQRSCKML